MRSAAMGGMSEALLRMLRARGDIESMTQQTLDEASVKSGDRWTFRETFDLSASDAEVVIANELPTDVLRVVVSTIRSDDKISGTVQTNPTIDTSGTAFRWIPDRDDGTDGTLPDGITVEYGGDYSSSGQSIPIQSTGGTGPPFRQTPLNTADTAVARIEPGGARQYTVSDDSGGDNTLVMTLVVSRAPQVK